MKRRPKIKTIFIIWEKENYNSVPRDAEVRRWIYHNGKRGTQYHVDEISEIGEIQNTYIYKYTTEGPILASLNHLWNMDTSSDCAVHEQTSHTNKD